MIRAAALGFLLTSSCSWATEPAQVDYMLNCQGCHLPDGSGFPARQVPDLRNQMGRFLSVPGGREYLVQVPGSAQTALPDADLARLLNWMLSSFSAAQIPADFQPYTAAEVGTLRQHPLASPSVVQAHLLEQIVQREQQQHSGALADE
ncbi:c-type cytochrome [Pseudomonas sp. H11T01]|uniref:c-type cytochrome n=1 Tax=Pseudomonas sp. H11T01 TaxID=3402749 RepID=UPI003ACF5959